MVDHASGEDVDLFLETELFVDVRLTDQDLQTLAATLEQRRLQQLSDERLALHIAQQQSQAPVQLSARALEAQDQKQPPASPAADVSSSFPSSSSSSPSPAPPPPHNPSHRVSTVPITASSLRRWHEAEVRRVEGRNVRVHFLEIPLAPLWINVDEGHDRLAELHVMTTAEREGRINKKEQLDLSIDCDEVFDEVVARCNVDAFLSASPYANGHASERDAALERAKLDFIRRWFSAIPHACVEVDGDVDMEGDEIRSESLTVPLFDPLTQSRLTVPVRTAACQHVHCMDLMTHIQHQKSQLEWVCVCGKEAYANLLQVDLFLLHILTEVTGSSSSSSSPTGLSHDFGVVPETRHVVINSDGSWRVQEDREKRKRKRDAADCSTSSSAAVSPAPTAVTHSNSAANSPLPSAATQSLFSLYPVSFPVVQYDNVEYIDLREEHPHDTAILDWLVQHWKVKTEKVEQQRRIQQAVAQEERKQPPPAYPSPSFFSPVPSPLASSRSQLATVISPMAPPPPPAAGRASHVKQLRQGQLNYAQRPRSPPSYASMPTYAHSQSLPKLAAPTSPPFSPPAHVPSSSSFPSFSSPSSPAPAVIQSPAPPSAVSRAPLPYPPAPSPHLPPSPPPSSFEAYLAAQSGLAMNLLQFPRLHSSAPAQSSATSASSSGPAQRQQPSPAPPARASSSALPQTAPPRPAPTPPRPPAPPRPAPLPVPAPGDVLNVNTCNEWQLNRAGFSYNVSNAIIAARQAKGAFGFQRMEELLEIKGIGKKTFDKLRQKLQI